MGNVVFQNDIFCLHPEEVKKACHLGVLLFISSLKLENIQNQVDKEEHQKDSITNFLNEFLSKNGKNLKEINDFINNLSHKYNGKENHNFHVINFSWGIFQTRLRQLSMHKGAVSLFQKIFGVKKFFDFFNFFFFLFFFFLI